LRPSRFVSLVAGALVALAIAAPAAAQGNSGGNKGGGNKGGKSPGPPPSTSALPQQTGAIAGGVSSIDGLATTAPFAWMDDASLMAPGGVWVGVSMVRWHGSGVSETIVPVVDGAIGLTPRLQLGASVPNVGGGVGTTFVSAKLGVYSDEARGLRIAAAPTLEIVGSAAMEGVTGQSRTQWGLPVSVHIDSDGTRFYGSSGYFSPGIWYAGAGVGRSVADRVGVSASFSRAWASSPSPAVTGLRRNEVSGGASYELKPNVAVYGSIGRTLGMAAEDGAGTTLSFGVSLSAATPILIE
jgi:hypothetical protein